MTPTPTGEPLLPATPEPIAQAGKTAREYAFLPGLSTAQSDPSVVYYDPIPNPLSTWGFSSLGWDGKTTDVLNASRMGDESYIMVLTQPHDLSIHFAVSQLRMDGSIVVDVVALDTQSANGYLARCDKGSDAYNAQIGPRHIVVECWSEGTGLADYRIVPLGNPDAAYVLPAPSEDVGRFGAYRMTWINDWEVYLLGDRAHTACLLDIRDPASSWSEPETCLTVPHFFGEVSPDGRWIEVRDGWEDSQPNRLGVIASSCIIDDSDPGCDPDWIEADIPYGDWRMLQTGVWSPDSRQLYLLNSAHWFYEEPGSWFEIWRLDRESNTLSIAGRIPNQPRMNHPDLRAGVGSTPIWSRDGSEILVSQADCQACEGPRFPLQAFSVETGELRTLTEEGGLVVAVLSPD